MNDISARSFLYLFYNNRTINDSGKKKKLKPYKISENKVCVVTGYFISPIRDVLQ